MAVFSPTPLPVPLARAAVRQAAPAKVVAANDYATRRQAAAAAALQGGTDFDALTQAFAAKASEKKAVEQQKKAQKEAEDKAPLWQKAIKVGLTGLAPATVPLKTVTALAAEATKHLPEGSQQALAHPFSNMFGKRPGTSDSLAVLDALSGIIPIFGQDPEKVQADKRSFLNKIAPTSTFGSQDVYQDIGGYGATGTLHLGLDIAHDPLTFLTGPEGRVVKEADHVFSAAKALRTAQEADRLAQSAKVFAEAEHAAAPTAETAARLANTTEAADRTAEAIANALDYVERAPTMERKILGDAKLPHTRAERANLVQQEMFRNGPDAFREFADDFRKYINEGQGALSPGAAEALGIEGGGMRFRVPGTKISKEIPGTELLVRGSDKTGQGIRKGINAVLDRATSGRAVTLAEGRMPTSAKQAFRMLRSKSATADDTVTALTFLGARQAMRRGEGAMTGAGRNFLQQAWKDTIRKMSKEDIVTLVRNAEADGAPNALNELTRRIAETYAQLSGRPIQDVLRKDWNTYLPHVMDPEFVRYLRDTGTDEATKDFKKLTHIVSDDTLEAEGHIDNARVLQRAPDGSPQTFKLGGKDVTITDDTIDGLNKTLKDAFPGYKGKNIYSNDPAVIMERYVKNLSEQAGVYSAANLVADAGLGLDQGFRIEGKILDALNARNAALARDPEAARVLETIQPGVMGAQPIPERPIVPGSAQDTVNRRIHDQAAVLQATAVTPDQQALVAERLAAVPPPASEFDPTQIFDSVEHRNATEALAERARSPEVQQHINDLRTNVNERTTQLLKDVRDVHTNMYRDIRTQVEDVQGQLDAIDSRIKEFRAQYDSIKGMRTSNPDELADVIRKVDHDITDLEAELKRKASTFKGKSTKAQNAVDKKLAEQLRQLKQLRADSMRSLSEEGSARIAAEVEARTKALFEPVRQAEEALQTKIASIPAPHAQGELNAAETFLTEQTGGPDGFQQLFNSYQATANPKVGTTERLVGGRLGLEEQRAVDLAAERSTKAIRPTSEYMQAHHDALAAQERLANATTKAEEVAAKKELREIDKRFAPGGDLFEERKARSVLARQAGYEARVTKEAAKERLAVEQARQLSRTQQESIVRDAAGRQIRAEGRGFLPGQERNVESVRQPAKAGQPTEQNAIERLQQQQLPGSEAHYAEAQQRYKAVNDFQNSLTKKTAQGKRAEAARIGAEADASMGPAAEQLGTMKDLAVDLNNKDVLLAKRKTVQDLKRELESIRIDPKHPTDRTLRYIDNRINDLLGVAAANPDLTDDSLTAVESMLHNELDNLKRLRNDKAYQETLQKVLRDDDLPKIYTTQLRQGWVTLHDGLPGAGDPVISTRLHQMFVNVKQANKQPKLFGRTFNALTNLFKTYATLTPGFHVRNALSGIFMNLADGVGFSNQLRAVRLWRKFREGGSEWLAEQSPEIRGAFEATFASGASGFFGEGGVADRSTSVIYNRLSNNRATRLSQRAGEWVEGPLRLAMGLDEMSKTGATVDSALERISRVHFDYSQTSDLDVTAKRLIPFWTFLSRNLPLQVMEVYHNPRWYSYYQSFQRDFSAEPDEFTPDYWGPLGVIPTGWHKGKNQIYLDPDIGLTRANSQIDQILGMVKNPGRALADVNPLIMAPIDFVSKRDSFYDRSFGPNDYTKVAGPLGAMLRVIATPLGQTNEKGQISENFLNLIDSLNPAYGRTTRLFPELVGAAGDPQRRGETVWRNFGVPVRVLSDKQKENEAIRRYYAARDEASRQRAMAREAAS